MYLRAQVDNYRDPEAQGLPCPKTHVRPLWGRKRENRFFKCDYWSASIESGDDSRLKRFITWSYLRGLQLPRYKGSQSRHSIPTHRGNKSIFRSFKLTSHSQGQTYVESRKRNNLLGYGVWTQVHCLPQPTILGCRELLVLPALPWQNTPLLSSISCALAFNRGQWDSLRSNWRCYSP